MYMPTVNKKYSAVKAKKEQERKARKMYGEGKTIYDILQETSLTEHEIIKLLGLG